MALSLLSSWVVACIPQRSTPTTRLLLTLLSRCLGIRPYFHPINSTIRTTVAVTSLLAANQGDRLAPSLVRSCISLAQLFPLRFSLQPIHTSQLLLTKPHIESFELRAICFVDKCLRFSRGRKTTFCPLPPPQLYTCSLLSGRCTRARGGALTTSGAGAGGLITEQRAVAVARCISAGEGGQSEIRSRAVLALANAASFPFSDGLRELMQVRPFTRLGH